MKSLGVDHVAIQANDFERSLHFYSYLLGFPVIKGPMQFRDRRLCFLDAGNIKVELFSTKESEGRADVYSKRRAGLVHFSLVVDDIEQTLRELSQQGVTVVRQAFRPPSGDPKQPLIAYIADPDEQEIEIREREGFRETNREGIDGSP